MSGARLFAIPPGADFARVFARGFHARMQGSPPERIAATRVLVTTGRAREVLETALADTAPAPGPLPRLEMIPDLQADPLLAPDLPPAIPPVRRQLRLTRLVERFLQLRHAAGETLAPPSAAADLSAELALLLDQMHDTGLDGSALDRALADGVLADEAARHWTTMRAFLDLVCLEWPRIREIDEEGALDARDRQRRVVERLAARWADDPPTDPVVAAGSTGSVASTAALLAAVARLPQGAVVLPGLDTGADPEIWEAAEDDHPMGPFRGLLDTLGVSPAEIAPWAEAQALPRTQLMSQALRPAPVTDHWHRAAAALTADLPEAVGDLALLEADSPRHEADAIAVAIREVLEEPDTTVALVSADAATARRVTASLGAFGVVPDDTMGQPLLLSPPGRLLRLALDVALAPEDAVALAALLQHPLTALGRTRPAHLGFARAFEREVLRTTPALHGLPAWGEITEDRAAWHHDLAQALAPLREALAGGASLAALLTAHAETLARLSTAPEGPPRAWGDEAGRQLASRLSALTRDAPAFGDGPVPDYRTLLVSLMSDAQVRPRPREPHPRVSIVGTREARFVDADVVILAGLNEGAWPQAADPGPWLSRPMRKATGLPLPERSVGLSAHDFLNVVCRPRVLVTRARKVEGSATVASRWLIRLETLVRGIGGEETWKAILGRGAALGDIATRHARPEATVPRVARPAARPPLEARPRTLPVTAIETLVRDAYAVYARHVLKLYPMDPLGRAPDMRDRGIAMHKVLERFGKASRDWPGPEAAAALLQEIADEVLAERVPWPDLRRTWRARIARFTPGYLSDEDTRRATGAPQAEEVKGQMTLALPGGAFEIRATADRIDRLADGTAAIYDYKTGAPPTPAQIAAGFNQQLHLQAAILADGGFTGLPAMTTARGAYIGLTGSKDGAEERAIEELGEQVAEQLDRVRELLAAYEAGAPYTSHGRPMRKGFAGDYDHLARVGEWIAEDGE